MQVGEAGQGPRPAPGAANEVRPVIAAALVAGYAAGFITPIALMAALIRRTLR